MNRGQKKECKGVIIMEEMIELAKSIGTIIAEIILVVYFCFKYINNMVKNTNDIAKGVKSQNDIDIELINKMDYYKELLNADRILIFEFHDGQHYSKYRHALKMSASYEVFRAGLNSSREQCSNLPVAIMPNLIHQIVHEGCSVCPNIEDVKDEMGNTYEFKKSLGIGAWYDVAIRDDSGEVIGFVAIQWNSKMPKDVDEEAIKHLAWFLEEKINYLIKEDQKSKKKFLGIF